MDEINTQHIDGGSRRSDREPQIQGSTWGLDATLTRLRYRRRGIPGD